ncbi:MAG: helix-turn-helix transcriptional regulator [Ruminococcaceae bacterium]|nr:helix-turn-helix transcriptional regulator [Oscillospiraceae bacterium]
MNNKLTVTIGNTPKTFFFQNGFYSRRTGISPIHKHYYTEIHIVTDGEINYSLDKKSFTVGNGEILAIPPNKLHSCCSFTEGAKHCSFLVDAPLKKIVRSPMPPETVKLFFKEINKTETNGNYATVASFLSLIYNMIFDSEKVSVERIVDYSFIIEEYLKINYARDIKLSDLASELNLSEKHTERLVKKYTGNTFKQELANIRIKTAQMLIASTNMTMTEISEYVGYNSYSGFYKAYKKNI